MSEDLHNPEEPTLAGLIKLAIATRLFDLHTSFSARVCAFDAEAQTVDVEMGYFRYLPRRRKSDGARTWKEERLPVLPAIPVVYPYGGGFSINFPIKIGDWVLIIAQEHAHGRMREINEPCDPEYRARFTLNGLVAIPGLHTTTKRGAEIVPEKLRLGSIDPSDAHITIGVDDVRLGGDDAVDFVAMNNKVVTAINNLITAFNNHTHAVTVGVSSGTAAAPTPMHPSVSDVGATKVKAK